MQYVVSWLSWSRVWLQTMLTLCIIIGFCWARHWCQDESLAETLESSYQKYIHEIHMDSPNVKKMWREAYKMSVWDAYSRILHIHNMFILLDRWNMRCSGIWLIEVNHFEFGGCIRFTPFFTWFRFQVLNLFRAFIDHLYKIDIVVPGIECAMAYLLQFQVITAADIWVFTRVVEDAMTFVLVRSREQATLVSCRLES